MTGIKDLQEQFQGTTTQPGGENDKRVKDKPCQCQKTLIHFFRRT